MSRTRVQYLAGASISTRFSEWKDDANTHYGIPSTLNEIPASKVMTKMIQDESGESTEIHVPDEFGPGSVLLFATDMDEMSAELDDICKEGADEAMADLDLVDLNTVLFRADGEEKDATGE